MKDELTFPESKLFQEPEITIRLVRPDTIYFRTYLSRDRSIGLDKAISRAEFMDNPIRILEDLIDEVNAIKERLWKPYSPSE